MWANMWANMYQPFTLWFPPTCKENNLECKGSVFDIAKLLRSRTGILPVVNLQAAWRWNRGNPADSGDLVYIKFPQKLIKTHLGGE